MIEYLYGSMPGNHGNVREKGTSLVDWEVIKMIVTSMDTSLAASSLTSAMVSNGALCSFYVAIKYVRRVLRVLLGVIMIY